MTLYLVFAFVIVVVCPMILASRAREEDFTSLWFWGSLVIPPGYILGGIVATLI